MRSVRLSDSTRRDICDNILKKGKCAEKELKLKERERGLFIALRDHTLGRHKEAYLALPSKFQVTDCSISIADIPAHSWKRILIHDEWIPCPVGVLVYSELPKHLQKKLIRFLAAKDKVEDEVKELKDTARQVVFSCASTKQLLELMPEAKEFFPSYLEINATSNLPIVAEQTVNELRDQLAP